MAHENNIERIQKLTMLREIVTNYSHQKHKSHFLPPNHKRYEWHNKFCHIKPMAWDNPLEIPYVAATSLIDAYSLLPGRPDIAFNSLWSAINSSYNNLYLSNHSNPGKQITDTKGIDYSVARIKQYIHEQIPVNQSASPQHSVTIFKTIKEYIKQASDKNFNFVATYILKGIAVENHNSNNPESAVRDIFIPSIYNTIKSKFPELYNKISLSTGAKYSDICSISETECKTDIDYGIPNNKADNSRKLIHATGKLIRQEILAFQPLSEHSNVIFKDEAAWLSFIIRTLLYATRNIAAHGNAATRLNSIFSNGESITSSSWTFLFGYCYFSLILLCQGKLSIADLSPIYSNSQIRL
ncbi:hypothetical protein [Aeromonas hydrophila]|uniref:hypothetical protein n=1 Tax=Aeromonas hydrophila TaxID=644 RepID=UPI003D1FE56B